MKKSLLKNNGVQSLIASLLCIVLGMLIGYIVLLFINPTGAGEAIVTVMKNFLNYNRADTQLKYLGNTLVKTAPLLMCALSILFAYKVGLFNMAPPVSTPPVPAPLCTQRCNGTGAGCPVCCWPSPPAASWAPLWVC